MPTQFEAKATYLGQEITVKSDDFQQLHQAISKIAELNQDANFLAQKTGRKDLVPNFRRDAEGNEYYGVSVRGRGPNNTFGQLREGGLIPFFPKGAEGFYDPENPPQRNGSYGGGQQGGGGQRQQQAPPQQQQAPPAQQQQQQAAQSQDNFAAKQQKDDLPF